MSMQLAKVPDQTLAVLDEIASQEFAMVQADVTKKFTAAMAVAAQVSKIKNALTKDVMDALVLPLKDAGSLGFQTDEGQRNTVYPPEIIRTCVTEALLRGAQLIGSEFMVFQGKTFFTKAYFERKVRTYPGLTNLDITCSTPRIMNGGALVEVTATFNLNGKPVKIERTGANAIAVRLQGNGGADAACGKAEKRILRFVLNYVSGYAPPSDPDDESEVNLKVVSGVSVVSNDPVDDGPKEESPVQVEPPKPAGNEAAKKAVKTVRASKAAQSAEVKLPPPPEPPKEEPKEEAPQEAPQDEAQQEAPREPGDESGEEPMDAPPPEEEEVIEAPPAQKSSAAEPKVVSKVATPLGVTWIQKGVKLRAKCEGIDFVSTVTDHGKVFAAAVQQKKNVAVEYKFIDKENVVQSVSIV